MDVLEEYLNKRIRVRAEPDINRDFLLLDNMDDCIVVQELSEFKTPLPEDFIIPKHRLYYVKVPRDV